MSEPDKREYFRIDDRLSIEFRYVTPEEFLRLENIIRYNPGHKTDKPYEMYFPGEPAGRTGIEENEVTAYLRVLERKLDLIIDLLLPQKNGVSYKTLFTPVNISGAGIRFNSDMPLNLGERVELRLALPLAPFSKISTLCEVLRAEEIALEDGPIAWDIALKFLVMNDYDRDFLINYVFVKEREALRTGRDNVG